VHSNRRARGKPMPLRHEDFQRLFDEQVKFHLRKTVPFAQKGGVQHALNEGRCELRRVLRRKRQLQVG
jgi:hypothetical protein